MDLIRIYGAWSSSSILNLCQTKVINISINLQLVSHAKWTTGITHFNMSSAFPNTPFHETRDSNVSYVKKKSATVGHSLFQAESLLEPNHLNTRFRPFMDMSCLRTYIYIYVTQTFCRRRQEQNGKIQVVFLIDATFIEIVSIFFRFNHSDKHSQRWHFLSKPTRRPIGDCS